MSKRALLLIPLLAGCPIGNNRFPKPADLPDSWDIDRVRVLGIRAEPPEVGPGDTVAFSALVTDPNDEAGQVVWLACGDGGSFGCSLPTDLDFENATLEDLIEAGVIGFEPGFPPTYTVPDDALDDIDSEFELRNGVYFTVQTLVLPQDLEGSFEGDDIDFNQFEAAYKRLVVSSKDPDDRNRNPEVAGWTVDGVDVPPGAVVELEAGQPYEIGIRLTDGSVEVYTYVNEAGESEERTEEPYAKWYTQGGVQREDATLWPFFEASWQAPSEDDGVTEGSWWVVVRDRRGGFAWSQQDWRLVP